MNGIAGCTACGLQVAPGVVRDTAYVSNNNVLWSGQPSHHENKQHSTRDTRSRSSSQPVPAAADAVVVVVGVGEGGGLGDLALFLKSVWPRLEAEHDELLWMTEDSRVHSTERQWTYWYYQSAYRLARKRYAGRGWLLAALNTEKTQKRIADGLRVSAGLLLYTSEAGVRAAAFLSRETLLQLLHGECRRRGGNPRQSMEACIAYIHSIHRDRSKQACTRVRIDRQAQDTGHLFSSAPPPPFLYSARLRSTWA
ncbi:hypothetical protein FN846DRAFT_309095 [Sphaerosporella brunnea]|uniref:Uncharacterized protein n=1 Tax=Sphaerosporella brunnea TaxID=1250544 RepID=A0A5J5F6J3_9PEZI|nr:hypothetical protein FN846DRAFT_309095 [Sphaerosporella brunnea]